MRDSIVVIIPDLGLKVARSVSPPPPRVQFLHRLAWCMMSACEHRRPTSVQTSSASSNEAIIDEREDGKLRNVRVKEAIGTTTDLVEYGLCMVREEVHEYKLVVW